MATAVLIDLSNYDTLLKQSTLSRAGEPNGNVFFDKTNGKIELITLQELATLNLGSGSEANPLDETLGIKFEAIYAFENQERADDEDLRKYNRWTSGTFKFGGAYNFINSRKPSIAADRAVIRGSGWNEYASDAGTDRIYFGNKGLSNVVASSQPYYQLAISDGSTTGTPINYAKPGQIDEAVQVYGDTTNVPSDATAGDFDQRTYEAVSIRTFGNTYDRKKTTVDLGITELGGYSTGFAVNEGPHLTTGNYVLASVLGGAQSTPWTGMTLQQLDASILINEFTQATGAFSWVLNNDNTGNLDQMVAYLDAVAATDIDIDVSGTNIVRGKRVDTWYSYNAAGKVVTVSGADGLGLYMYNVPTADKQRVLFTDDHGNTKAYAFSVSVEAEVGAVAKADTNAWYHSFFAASYNTPGAVTVKDSGVVDVIGSALNADGNNKIIFEFDYTGDTYGGTPNTNKNCVFLCEGDGGATQAKTLYTITEQTTVAFTCAPGVENNA